MKNQTPFSDKFVAAINRNRVIALSILLLSASVSSRSVAAEMKTLMNIPFSSETDLKGWSCGKGVSIVKTEDGGNALQVISSDTTKIFGARYSLNAAALAGRRVVLSVEVKRKVEMPSARWQGAKLMLSYAIAGKDYWPGIYMQHGDFGWEKKQLELDVPMAARNISIFLGIQSAKGWVLYRDLKLEISDYTLSLEPLANMGLKDEIAGDGKGGWSDQGKENDASGFQYRQQRYAGTPFHIADPRNNNGKAVIVFKSPRFSGGIDQVELKLNDAGVSGRYLYLLHTLTWGFGTKKPVGYIDLIGKNNRIQTIAVNPDVDVADWWTPREKPNAYPASIWKNHSGGIVGVYRSRFSVDKDLGNLSAIRFRSGESGAIWIVLGATVSDNHYSRPVKKSYVIKPGPNWKALPFPSVAGVARGSALDLSWLNPKKIERIIINKEGHFARESTPNESFRFQASSFITDPFIGRGKEKPDFVDKERIEEYAEQFARAGYNMVRFHYPDAVMLVGARKDFELNPDFMDKFDYFVYCLKKRGIYLNVDAMASRIGWSHGYSWSPKPGDKRSFKLDLHFDRNVRENWFKGVKAFLTHMNPYTKSRLADDPVLAIMVAYNEQEFAFIAPGRLEQATPYWHAFLEKRYRDISALNRAWNSKYASFASVGDFSLALCKGSETRNMDAARFLTGVERETYDFYRKTVRDIGFKGPIAAYNMAQSLRYDLVRSGMDYVAINGYHAHPFGDSINPCSGISMASNMIRSFSAVRQYGRPFVITEHSHGYWNRYRYEQGLTMGAYASFQDYNGLTAFGTPVSVYNIPRQVSTFAIKSDPITRASEFVTALMFLRRDVRSADLEIRYQVHPEALYESGSINDAMNSDETRMALICRISVEQAEAKSNVKKNELLLPAIGGAPIIFDAYDKTGVGGYTQAGESKKSLEFNFDKTLAALKTGKKLPESNRSSIKDEIFESSTGEILMDCRKNLLSVNTPRIQGVCSEPGAGTKLDEFEIVSHSTRGSFTIASVDGMKNIVDAERLVLVCSTNVMNSGDTFSDESCRTRLKSGSTDILLNTGRFHLRLKNRNAAGIKCYALGIDGARIGQIPVKASGDRLELQIDTAQIPSIYFELIAEK